MPKAFRPICLLLLILSLAGAVPAKEGKEEDKDREPPKEEPVFCTMDAKMCPDGSFVGRIPPDCRFAPCPDSKKREGDK